MKQTKTFTLPVGYGGNMDYSNIKVTSYEVKNLKEGYQATLVVEKTDNKGEGLVFHFNLSDSLAEAIGEDVTNLNFLTALRLLELSEILPHRGLYDRVLTAAKHV